MLRSVEAELKFHELLLITLSPAANFPISCCSVTPTDTYYWRSFPSQSSSTVSRPSAKEGWNFFFFFSYCLSRRKPRKRRHAMSFPQSWNGEKISCLIKIRVSTWSQDSRTTQTWLFAIQYVFNTKKIKKKMINYRHTSKVRSISKRA